MWGRVVRATCLSRELLLQCRRPVLVLDELIPDSAAISACDALLQITSDEKEETAIGKVLTALLEECCEEEESSDVDASALRGRSWGMAPAGKSGVAVLGAGARRELREPESLRESLRTPSTPACGVPIADMASQPPSSGASWCIRSSSWTAQFAALPTTGRNLRMKRYKFVRKRTAAQICEEWRCMPADQKIKWEEEAALAMDRYRDDHARGLSPKKPPSAYFLWTMWLRSTGRISDTPC